MSYDYAAVRSFLSFEKEQHKIGVWVLGLIAREGRGRCHDAECDNPFCEANSAATTLHELMSAPPQVVLEQREQTSVSVRFVEMGFKKAGLAPRVGSSELLLCLRLIAFRNSWI